MSARNCTAECHWPLFGVRNTSSVPPKRGGKDSINNSVIERDLIKTGNKDLSYVLFDEQNALQLSINGSCCLF